MQTLARERGMVVRHEMRRFLLRAVIIRYSLQVAAFWTAAMVAAAWLAHFGLSAVALALLVVWAFLSIPALATQAFPLIDLANYALSGQVHLMRRVINWIQRAERDPAIRAEMDVVRQRWIDERARRPLPVRVLIRLMELAWDVSPLLPLATWALIVLLRLPSAQAVSRESAREAPELLKAMRLGAHHPPASVFAH